MCGIVGYTGHRNAREILLGALERVTYRGYDSFGIAIVGPAGLQIHRSVGPVDSGQAEIPGFTGTTGIAHTRWASSGEVSTINAHPFLDCTGRLGVVHNGQLENDFELKQDLTVLGHAFSSDTDSEVFVHLIEDNDSDSLLESVAKAARRVMGTYAIAVTSGGSPDIIVAKNGNPMVVGLGDGENFIASDVPALEPLTHRVLYLEDGDVARVSPTVIEIWAGNRRVSRRIYQMVSGGSEPLFTRGFPHHMLKEIHDQPGVMGSLARKYSGRESTKSFKSVAELVRSAEDTVLIGCGSSFHAALLGAEQIDPLVSGRVRSLLASEFRAPKRVLSSGVAIALSQSGETADTISALKDAAAAGYRTVALTNSEASTLARLSDHVVDTCAGREVSVAATKSFLAQVYTLQLLATAISKDLSSRLAECSAIESILTDISALQEAGEYFQKSDDLFVIGQGQDIPVAMETALKFKEVAYVHAEAMAASELKHGPFALLGPMTPVLAFLGGGSDRKRMITTLREVRSRGAPVVAIGNADDGAVRMVADLVIQTPSGNEPTRLLAGVVIGQLLAYFCGVARGTPIDRPRNLAKSVTVP